MTKATSFLRHVLLSFKLLYEILFSYHTKVGIEAWCNVFSLNFEGFFLISCLQNILFTYFGASSENCPGAELSK